MESDEHTRKESNEFGYVSIASTESFRRDGFHKIGSTNDWRRRIKDLSASTSAPEKFFLERFVRCSSAHDAELLEKGVHEELDKLGARVRKKENSFTQVRPSV